MVPLCRVSLAILALQCIDQNSTIKLLQTMKILGEVGYCQKCGQSVGGYINNGNYNYVHCRPCNSKTSILHNAVLSNSNTKLRTFIFLMYMFCNNHRTYETVQKETWIPVEGYKDTKVSSETINKWFTFYRHLCVEDAKRTVFKIGGENVIVEMDESMCGKLKFGLGDGRKRRRQWIFGGIDRSTGRIFMRVCPDNKRTKKALWPIIQAHVLPGSMLYTDGWRAYRKLPTLGYQHRWLDHSKYYVHPDDPTLHTNGVEGLWGTFKRWLPQQGRYNLEEYMWLYMWVQEKKLNGEDPFWALVKLVEENNKIELLEKVTGNKAKEPDTEAAPYNAEEEEAYQREVEAEEEDQDSDAEDSDENDEEIYHYFDCVFCKNIFRAKDDLISHISMCDMK
jgi:transposase